MPNARDFALARGNKIHRRARRTRSERSWRYARRAILSGFATCPPGVVELFDIDAHIWPMTEASMAQHKSERTTNAAATRGGRKSGHASSLGGGILASTSPGKTVAKRGRATSEETIEARLDRKAAIADGQASATRSLGQMSREQRHKLLYGD